MELLLQTWATEIIVKGFKRTLQLSDLTDLVTSETAEKNLERFSRFYKEEKRNSGGKDVSVGRVLFKALLTRYVMAILVLLLALTFSILGPVSSLLLLQTL